MPRSFTQLYDGDAVELNPKGEVLFFACCDCGLVHKFSFAVEKNGNIGFALRRHKTFTKERRRELRKAET